MIGAAAMPFLNKLPLDGELMKMVWEASVIQCVQGSVKTLT